MSTTRQPGPYTEAEVEEMRLLYSNEKVAYLVEQAQVQAEADEDVLGTGDSGEGGESESPVDYDKLNKPELTKLLGERGLETSGTNKEQADRLREDDEKKKAEADDQSE